MKLSPDEIAHVALTAWSGADARIAIAVALAESSGDTDALGRSTTGTSIGNRDHGLWQVSNRWHGAKLVKTPNWRDPYVNAQLALQVWREGGWKLWSTFNPTATKPASYEQYLPDADIALKSPFAPPASSDAVIRELAKEVMGLESQLNDLRTKVALNAATLGEIREHFAV